MDERHFENTKRIAKNTFFLYGRMAFGLLVSLYTSRVIINSLGIEDYGIYNVVGGFVAMFSLVSSALTTSISRFLTFEIGRNNQTKLKEIFSTSLLIQLCLSGLILVIAETVGIWFVNCKMAIPADRLYAANWVFQASVIGFILALLSTPYNAAIIAHEKMNAYAYFGILQVFLNLGTVLFIAYVPFWSDRLMVYSGLMVIIAIIMQILYLSYCYRYFPESRVRPTLNRQSWKDMSGFAGWNAIGCSASILKDQGVNMLLNIFFGPVVNAARGISVSVLNSVVQFSGNFMTALNPQITKSYASGDHAYMFSIVERGSRFSYYIMFMLSMPIILEAPFILDLWLVQYPDNTILFVRLVLIYALINVLSSTLITLQVATGKIRNYQIAVGGLLLLNFPISWLALYLGAEPYAVYIVAICICIVCLILRLRFLQSMTGLTMRRYFRNVVVNVFFISICALVLPLFLSQILHAGFLRLILVGITSVISSSAVILFIGCSPSERSFILSKATMLKSKFLRATA